MGDAKNENDIFYLTGILGFLEGNLLANHSLSDLLIR